MSADTPLDLLMSKREMLTQFNAEFTTRHTSLKTDLEAVHEKLEEAIAEEDIETKAIADVKEQLDEMVLSKDLEDLEAAQAELDTKFKIYRTLVEMNDIKAEEVLDAISESQPLIDDINKTIAGISDSIASVHMSIDTFRSKPKVSSS